MTDQPPSGPGLRERKKQETRVAIFRAAMRLFVAEGFDNVTVAQVADAANVSKMTVFNYFPTKEDLVFIPMGEQIREVGRFVRDRAPGESALSALRREFLEELALRDPQIGLDEAGVDLMRVIRNSPTLIVRAMFLERQQEQELANLLAAEAGAGPDDMGPRVAAAAVLGVRRVVSSENWRRILLGESADAIYPDAAAHAELAFNLLIRGLGEFCVR